MQFESSRFVWRVRVRDLEFTWHRLWGAWMQWRLGGTYAWLGPLTIRRVLP